MPIGIAATLSNVDADGIQADAANVLQTNDGPGDVSCKVLLRRDGNVEVFATGDGSLDTSAELSAVFNLAGNVKVVGDVNYCANKFNTSYIGCGQTPGTSFITERFTANQEGILWGHEFGHNQGLPHRNTSTNNVMYFSVDTNRRHVNQLESNAFLGQPDQIAAAREPDPTRVGTPDGAPMSVDEFVSQIYFDGLPLDQAATYCEADVGTLIRMLNDPGMVQYHENIALTLGMIGSPRAVDSLISYISEGSRAAVMSRPAYKERVGSVVALGYLVNRSGSEAALNFLLESTSPGEWGQRTFRGLDPGARSFDATTRDLSKYAIIALGLSGNPKAAEHLRGMRDQAGTTAAERSLRTDVRDVVTQSLQLNEQISRDGLLKYYKI